MKSVASPPSTAEEARTLDELALARVLEECLEAIERGETDLDGLAGRYSEAQDDVWLLLEIAQQLRAQRAKGAPLSVQFREELRERLKSRQGTV